VTRPGLSHKRATNLKQFYFGAPYYPEHWSEADRADDAARMKAAGFNCVRMAEFAWDRIEPAPGAYDFALFDAVIQTLAAEGIQTFLCTPTATPPAWLTRAHPEMLRVNADGVALQHGSRQHCCHSSPQFRAESRRITRVMADHYAGHPAVIGWQTDNEIHCHFSECHCPSCQAAFVEFLRRRYEGDIAALNRAWGTAFWAQTYRDFAEIPTPRNKKPTYANPSHLLDYYRFLSHSATEFQRDQVTILREANPNWLIFHNGCFRHIDYRGGFVKDLDFLGYDVYPMFVDDPVTRRFNHSFGLDVTRSYSGNFIVPEHQSGPGGQGDYQLPTPEPGEIRRMTYTTIGRGADSILYFRWRTCRYGAEMYWYGILDHDNVPRRRYEEIARIGAEMKKIGPEILGTHVFCDVAVAHGDFDSLHAHDTFSLGLPSQHQIAALCHRYLMSQGCQVGCVHPSDDLSDLKVYIIPHWEIVNPDWVPNLEAFVKRGGTLIVGARTACRNQDNQCYAEPLPGALRGLVGAIVQEVGRIRDPQARPIRMGFAHQSVVADLWYETLQPDPGGARELHHWHGRRLDGQVAATIRDLGRGRVVYVGTYLTEPILQALMPPLLNASGLTRPFPLVPPTVEVIQRIGAGHKIVFFINHAEEPAALAGLPAGMDLLAAKPAPEFHVLDPNDVLILKIPTKAEA